MRKHFFVKPNLQVKYLGFTLLIVLLSSLGVYLVFETTLRSWLVPIPLSSVDAANLQSNLRLTFVWMLLILLVACGVEAYLFFHRLAGPLFVLERELRQIGEGNFDRFFHLRKSDELQDVFRILEEMKTNLKDRNELQIKLLTETKETLEKLIQQLPNQDRYEHLRQEAISLKDRIRETNYQA